MKLKIPLIGGTKENEKKLCKENDHLFYFTGGFTVHYESESVFFPVGCEEERTEKCYERTGGGHFGSQPCGIFQFCIHPAACCHGIDPASDQFAGTVDFIKTEIQLRKS